MNSVDTRDIRTEAEDLLVKIRHLLASTPPQQKIDVRLTDEMLLELQAIFKDRGEALDGQGRLCFTLTDSDPVGVFLREV